MSGIRLMERDGTATLHPVIRIDPEEVPVFFLVRSQEVWGVAHPDYVMGELWSVQHEGRDMADAWDRLMIQTPEMELPAVCFVDVKTEDGKDIATFRSGSRMGPVRYRAEV